MKLHVYEWKLSQLAVLEVDRLPNMNKEDFVLDGQAYSIEAIELGERTSIQICAIGERCECGDLAIECSIHRPGRPTLAECERMRAAAEAADREASALRLAAELADLEAISAWQRLRQATGVMGGAPADAVEDTTALYDQAASDGAPVRGLEPTVPGRFVSHPRIEDIPASQLYRPGRVIIPVELMTERMSKATSLDEMADALVEQKQEPHAIDPVAQGRDEGEGG